jgi:hypothetical protein
MSATSTTLAVVPNVDHPNWQPDIALPSDVLHIVIKFYTRFRLEELKNDALDKKREMFRTRYRELPAEWSVLPILQTCRLFYDIAIPLLYRKVVTIGNSKFVTFLEGPAIASFNYIQDLHLRDIGEGSDLHGLNKAISDREMQFTLNSVMKDPCLRAGLESSIVEFRNIRLRKARLPIKVMKIGGTLVQAVRKLLRLLVKPEDLLANVHPY